MLLHTLDARLLSSYVSELSNNLHLVRGLKMIKMKNVDRRPHAESLTDIGKTVVSESCIVVHLSTDIATTMDIVKHMMVE